MCNNCIHKAVCSIYRATGGVKKCEHHKEETECRLCRAALTLNGYNAEALVLIAEMLRKKMITEDELDNFLRDFTKMYEIIIREQKTIISGAMATFKWPSVGDVVEKMWEERNKRSDMRGAEDG